MILHIEMSEILVVRHGTTCSISLDIIVRFVGNFVSYNLGNKISIGKLCLFIHIPIFFIQFKNLYTFSRIMFILCTFTRLNYP